MLTWLHRRDATSSASILATTRTTRDGRVHDSLTGPPEPDRPASGHGRRDAGTPSVSAISRRRRHADSRRETRPPSVRSLAVAPYRQGRCAYYAELHARSYDRGMAGHARGHNRPADVRSRPRRAPAARSRIPRGARLVGVLRGGRTAVRRRVRNHRRMGPRRAVLRRLHRREEPVRRQPVRVHDHHEHVRGPGRTTGACADDRDRRRARAAGPVHRRRRGAARRLLVHVPDLRSRAAAHRDPVISPPRRGSVGRRQRAGRRRRDGCSR